MNRRGFISLMAGAAGAPLVPWRGLIEPLIVLPNAAPKIERYTYRAEALAFAIDPALADDEAVAAYYRYVRPLTAAIFRAIVEPEYNVFSMKTAQEV